MRQQIIVGLSGGVDSAVAAALLLEQGHSVEALFMRNWSEDDAYCSAAEDQHSAQVVADQLGIPLHFADFSSAYKERVFADFLNEYRQGRTPSPDLLCNREIKFGDFAEHAYALGADCIATGHYAQLRQEGGRAHLLRAADATKDQTYFLAATPGSALRRTLFPLGRHKKSEVRALAANFGLHNHQRKDSTGVCFIGERPMREFLRQWLAATPGPIETDAGQRVGEHQGVAFYTLGQREGLGIGGVRGAREAPWYVAERQVEANRLIVTQDRDDPRLNSLELTLGRCYWINEPPPPTDGYQLRIRHRQAWQEAAIASTEPYRIQTKLPQWAAAVGQYAVLYRADECLGCGVIESASPTAGQF